MLSIGDDEAIREERAALEDFNQGCEVDRDFFALMAQLQNAWHNEAKGANWDKSGLPCDPAVDVADFCSVHASPFEHRSAVCAIATLQRNSAPVRPPSQFLSSLIDCHERGTSLTWPQFISDLAAGKLNACKQIDVLIDFSGACGEHGGFLLRLDRPQPENKPVKINAFRRSGDLKQSRKTVRGEKPVGNGDHLVIRLDGQIRLARRLQRAPNATEFWSIYPASSPWRPPNRRSIVMPLLNETDPIRRDLWQKQIDDLRKRDPDLEILFEETVPRAASATRDDSRVEILFVATPPADALDSFRPKVRRTNNAP